MESVRWLNDEETDLWISFLAVSQMVERLVDQQLRRDFNISHSDYEILARLSQAPGRWLRMGELANTIVAPKSRLSHQMERLEKSGWVERKNCPTDGRGVVAELTEAGLDLLIGIAPAHVTTVRENFIDLIPQEQLEPTLQALKAVLKSIPGAPQSLVECDPAEVTTGTPTCETDSTSNEQCPESWAK